MDNLPLIEQWHKAAEDWVDKNHAANLLEESKSAVLSRRKADLGDIPDSHAERIVKASSEWQQYIDAMCEARKKADLAKVNMIHLDKIWWEYQSRDANFRRGIQL